MSKEEEEEEEEEEEDDDDDDDEDAFAGNKNDKYDVGRYLNAGCRNYQST